MGWSRVPTKGWENKKKEKNGTIPDADIMKVFAAKLKLYLVNTDTKAGIFRTRSNT